MTSSGLLALEALTAEELSRLAELEGVVERGRRTFLEVGNALEEIREVRLYKGTHTSFADYVHDRWDISRRRADQLIAAFQTTTILTENREHCSQNGASALEIPDDFGVLETPNGNNNGAPFERSTWQEERRAQQITNKPDPLPAPANESVARRLAATAKKDPDRAREIWRQTVERFGPDASAQQVSEIASVAEVLPDVSEDAKRCASAIRRAVKTREPQAAKQALAIWRATVYGELDRIARGS